MQFKPFLRPFTTYVVENGIAYTKIGRSQKESIPLRDAHFKSRNPIFGFGSIEISSNGKALVWTELSNTNKVLNALEAERQTAINPALVPNIKKATEAQQELIQHLDSHSALLKQATQIKADDSIIIEMVRIPAGEFYMLSDREPYALIDGPRHLVKVGEFKM